MTRKAMSLGFDFGTSYSAIACIDRGVVKRIPIGGAEYFPSSIYFPPQPVSLSDFSPENYRDEIKSHVNSITKDVESARRNYESRSALTEKKYRSSLSDAKRTYKGHDLTQEIEKIKSRYTIEKSMVSKPLDLGREQIIRMAESAARNRWIRERSSREFTLVNLMQDSDAEIYFGNEAVSNYVDFGGRGTLMANPKSLLALKMTGPQEKAITNALSIFFRKAIEMAIKEIGEGVPVGEIVIGRPVHYRGNRRSDGDAQAIRIMSQAMIRAGFEKFRFMEEPAAAALAFHKMGDSETRALIVDLGGGTSDFSLASLGGGRRSPKIIESRGVAIGGTDVDRQLNMDVIMPIFGRGNEFRLVRHAERVYALAADTRNVHGQAEFQKLSIEGFPEPYRSRLTKLKSPGETYELSRAIELAKVGLSLEDHASIKLSHIQRGKSVDVNLLDLGRAAEDYKERILFEIRELADESFSRVILTGGMSRCRGVLEWIREIFSDKEISLTGSSVDVVSGLALSAKS